MTTAWGEDGNIRVQKSTLKEGSDLLATDLFIHGAPMGLDISGTARQEKAERAENGLRIVELKWVETGPGLGVTGASATPFMLSADLPSTKYVPRFSDSRGTLCAGEAWTTSIMDGNDAKVPRSEWVRYSYMTHYLLCDGCGRKVWRDGGSYSNNTVSPCREPARITSVSIFDSRQLNQIAGPGNHNLAVDGLRSTDAGSSNDETFIVLHLPLFQLSRHISVVPIAIALQTRIPV
ncbi:hypothetical protein F5X97DRAFT_328396 [Nemania serpens]|nr:hypothetical protein F5X97DRAFT_328396 [Nemania serpens]